MTQLKLSDYMPSIQLRERYIASPKRVEDKEKLVNELIKTLMTEKEEFKNITIPFDYDDKRILLRSLLNARKPEPLKLDLLQKLDALLQTELMETDLTEVEQLETISTMFPNGSFRHAANFVLWKGDITRLKADAIVNAANKYMLGCFQPLHACIDNAIHSAAGPQLRRDCEVIMSLQQELEKTGEAKITRGYNLPSKFVLHTVGPIVPKGTKLTEEQKNELASCYISCLDLANKMPDIKSIGFCAISTGVFGFPKQEAAKIALKTVDKWLTLHPNHFEKIVFNVFSTDDYNVYSGILNN